MQGLAKRAEQAGVDIEFVMKNALKITEEYAGSGAQSVTPEVIVDVFERMLIAQIEVFEVQKQ